MLRLCLSAGGFRHFLRLTLEEGYMSQYYQQQQSIRTTIPSLYRYRAINKILEDESIGIKLSTRVLTRADCVCESLKKDVVVDLSGTLDCCPFRKKKWITNWRMEKFCSLDYHLTMIRMFIHELPKLALDANDIEDFKKWMEFVHKNPQNLQEKDAQMALMIENKRGKAEAKNNKNL